MVRRSLSGEELELHELTTLDDDDGKRSDEHQELVTQRYGLYSPEEDKKVLKKLDRRVVLFIAFLYLLSFLDRSNIGNARIAGLQDDLHLNPGQYDMLLTIFYLTYIAFEWMALLFRLIPPHIYISLTVLFWGLLASAQSLTTSFPQLLVLRMLLGISEAAFCGVPFYLSFFFKRAELASRIGVFISAAPLATTFASSLAWLITWLGKKSPIAPWRMLLLVEGFPSILVAVWVWSALPDGPESAWFFSRREREVALLRLQEDKEEEDEKRHHITDEKATTPRKTVKFNEVLQTIKDPKCYLTAAMFFSCNVAFSSMPVFLPTIINELGYTSLRSQALSAPPYLLSFIIVLLTARASDLYRVRSTFILLHALLAASGYTLSFLGGALDLPPILRYVAVYPACVGFFSCVTLIITWTINNQDTDSKRGTGVAMLQFLGQCGPLLGTRLYPESDGPLYLRGMGICAGFMVAVGVLAQALRFVLARENARRIEMDAVGEDGAPLMGSDGRQAVRKELFFYVL